MACPAKAWAAQSRQRGDGLFLPPSHPPSARSLQAKISGPAQALPDSLTHSLSWLAWTTWTCLWVGSTGPTAGGRPRRQHASTFTKHRGSVIIHDHSGFFQAISSSWPRCGPAANNGGAMGTAGTARRWTAWGHGAWSVNLTIGPMCVRWGHVLGAFGGSRDRGTNSRQLDGRAISISW